MARYMTGMRSIAFLLVLIANLAAAAPIEDGDARFTVITPNLIRIEISPQRKFVDERSMFAINRDATFDVKPQITGDELSIDTGQIRIKHANGELTGQILVDGKWIDW